MPTSATHRLLYQLNAPLNLAIVRVIELVKSRDDRQPHRSQHDHRPRRGGEENADRKLQHQADDHEAGGLVWKRENNIRLQHRITVQSFGFANKDSG